MEFDKGKLKCVPVCISKLWIPNEKCLINTLWVLRVREISDNYNK